MIAQKLKQMNVSNYRHLYDLSPREKPKPYSWLQTTSKWHILNNPTNKLLNNKRHKNEIDTTVNRLSIRTILYNILLAPNLEESQITDKVTYDLNIPKIVISVSCFRKLLVHFSFNWLIIINLSVDICLLQVSCLYFY